MTAIPLPLALEGIAEIDLPAVQEDRAGVPGVKAREDLDQGRLAGAVFPYQGVDLAALDADVHVAQGLHAREALGHRAHLQQGSGGSGHGSQRPLARLRMLATSTASTMITPLVISWT